MNIGIITPAPPRSRRGNRITALRWARLLRDLGHRVYVEQSYQGRRCDVLVALHALRSFPSIRRFASDHAGRPLLVALTGTDLYGAIRNRPQARESLKLASRLILLQPKGMAELPKAFRGKACVIYQSVKAPPPMQPRRDVFEVCVLGHLRKVKDPFRTARAVRLLPASSRICVTHAGAALNQEMARVARRESETNPRYQWVGELPRWRALRILARSRLLALTSKMEGGANVVSEAIAGSVPVVSSRIAGSIGLLGEKYPGYFSVGDTRELASLLHRAESEAGFLRSLNMACSRLRSRVDPAHERRSWQKLLKEL